MYKNKKKVKNCVGENYQQVRYQKEKIAKISSDSRAADVHVI